MPQVLWRDPQGEATPARTAASSGRSGSDGDQADGSLKRMSMPKDLRPGQTPDAVKHWKAAFWAAAARGQHKKTFNPDPGGLAAADANHELSAVRDAEHARRSSPSTGTDDSWTCIERGFFPPTTQKG